MKATERYIVGYGPEQVQDVTVHEDGVIETVTTKPVRVFEKRPDGALTELFDEAKSAALVAFWADAERFNEQQEN
ncbi:hypothetical protein OG786_21075 [Streptomyces sp. NBC_00101]|uniref:hypothetical protein n=1 Tax=Streptomyces sp. NBC_00101 TaxID=2975651 RepID=UPI00324E5F48